MPLLDKDTYKLFGPTSMAPDEIGEMKNKEPKKEFYSWEFYHTLVTELQKQITPRPNIVVGIGKGGLVPGIILAEYYECTLINYGLRSYNKYENGSIHEYQPIQNFETLRDANILIIDDIADSGNTFNYAVNVFKKNFCDNIITASVFYKPKSAFKPNFIAREMSNDVWIVQPWESI